MLRFDISSKTVTAAVTVAPRHCTAAKTAAENTYLCRSTAATKNRGTWTAAVRHSIQLDFQAAQNMAKRRRNLSYNISLERYGSLLSARFYRLTFQCLCKKLWSIEWPKVRNRQQQICPVLVVTLEILKPIQTVMKYYE